MDAKARAAADAAMIPTGPVENGPYSKLSTQSYDEFTAKYGIRDDLVKQPLPPEQRAKVNAWMEETLARKGAADLAARHRDARDRLFSAYPAGDEARGRMEWPAELVSFDDVIKAARKWLAECDPAATGVLLHIGVDPETATTDPRFLAGLAAREIESRGSRDWFVSRAFVSRAFVLREHARSDENAFVRYCMQADGPPGHLPPRLVEREHPPVLVGIDLAETEFSRAQRSRRVYEAPPRPVEPPRYSAKPKPAKPPIDPEVKAEWRSEQRQRKALKAKQRARRGWS